MNTALALTHDSIVGYWTGEATQKPPLFGTPEDDTNLEYLPEGIRNTIVDGELASLWRVSGKDGQATVELNEHPVFSLKRPSVGFFEAQLTWLRAYSDLRGDRIAEINVQTGDVLSFFGAVAYLNDGRRKKTLELLYAVYRLVYRLEHSVKHLCRSARPIDLSNEVQPIIQTPAHSAYPSGHATESFAFATILHHLMEGKGARDGFRGAETPMLYRLASRIAVNRTVAGVHFPVDTLAGGSLGCAIGDALAGLVIGAEPISGTLDPTKGGPMAASEDFNISMIAEIVPEPPKKTRKKTKAPIFAELWAAAAKEWEPA